MYPRRGNQEVYRPWRDQIEDMKKQNVDSRTIAWYESQLDDQHIDPFNSTETGLNAQTYRKWVPRPWEPRRSKKEQRKTQETFDYMNEETRNFNAIEPILIPPQFPVHRPINLQNRPRSNADLKIAERQLYIEEMKPYERARQEEWAQKRLPEEHILEPGRKHHGWYRILRVYRHTGGWLLVYCLTITDKGRRGNLFEGPLYSDEIADAYHGPNSALGRYYASGGRRGRGPG